MNKAITEERQHRLAGPTAAPQRFSLGMYFQCLTRLLGQPRHFFSELDEKLGWKAPFGFLLVSSLFFAGASLIGSMPEKTFVFGSIFFLNALGMTLIAACAGYGVMTMIFGRRVPFVRFFSIYAFSSGVTLLAAWVPFFIWLTEPWKWWLIGIGLRRGLGFSWRQTLVIIGISVAVICLFFWSLLPILAALR